MNDSFFRNDQGKLQMGHLLALVAAMVGVVFSIVSVVGFFGLHETWDKMGQYSVALLGAGTLLEYGQSRLDNKR